MCLFFLYSMVTAACIFKSTLLCFVLFVYFIDYAITIVPFFSPLYPSLPGTPIPSSISTPPSFMFMDCTYKFFGFPISHTILSLPLSIFYLPFMLLIPCTFSLIIPPPPLPLITLRVISISVILFLF